MSSHKTKVTDKASEIAKNIWLAGVGAYGKAVDDAQGRLEKAGVETPRLFVDLVKAGAALEDEAREALENRRVDKRSVEERIDKVREHFNMQRQGNSEELAALSRKVDLISKKLDLLTTALTEQGVIRDAKPPRKTSPKRKSVAKAAANSPAKKSIKTASKKKPVAKQKTASRKTTTRKAPRA